MQTLRVLVRENLGLVFAALGLIFLSIRILAISGYDQTTASAVLKAQGTGAVVVGTLFSLFPLIGFLSALGWLVWRIGVPGKLRWWEWLGIAVLAVFLVPFWTVVAMSAGLILTLMITGIQHLQANGNSSSSVPSEPRALRLCTVALAAVVAVSALVQERPWLPAERISGPDGLTVGYVLEESDDDFTILTLEDRKVVRVSGGKTTKRSICAEPPRVDSNVLDAADTVISEMTPLFGLYRLGRGVGKYPRCDFDTLLRLPRASP